MIWNCIWWWGFTPGTLVNAEYSIFAINLRSTQIPSSSTCYSPNYGSNKTIQLFIVLQIIKLCAKDRIMLSRIRRNLRSVKVKKLEVSESKMELYYYIHFWTNTHGRVMNTLSLLLSV